jgi:hypothetical protein
MKFKFAQATYIENVFYPVPDGVEFSEVVDVPARHVPGPHWFPVDDAAKARCAEYGVTYTGMVPDGVEALTLQLAEAQAAAKKREELNGNPAAIAAALVAALIEGGIIPAPKKVPAKQMADVV